MDQETTPAPPTFLLLLSLLALLAPSAPASSTPPCNGKCFVEVSRYIGARPFYALICKSGFDTGRATLRRFLPSRPNFDTVGRAQAAERCFRRTRAHLDRACNHATTERDFMHRTMHIMRRCVDRPHMTPAERRRSGPYRQPPPETCTSRTVEWKKSPTVLAIAFLRECVVDDFFETGNTIAEYFIKSDSPDINQHFAFVRKCGKTFAKDLENIAVSSPADYQLLGLHLLQACCKRHTPNSNLKFRCEDIVPADVSGLKAVL